MHSREVLVRLIDNIEKVIVGKTKVVELVVVGLLSNGHILIEDVPGVGKTMLARALAQSINADFKRIQFTPDLLPTDVTGGSMYNQKTGEFEFRPGPIFANIVLADEINRTTPRTQSSLLECMQEYRVTADGKVYPLPRPFLVIATQNPIEFHGTYPLPEAQVDRFLMKLDMGYPSQLQEDDILTRQKEAHPIEFLKPVVELSEILALQREVSKVEITPEMISYITRIVSLSRKMEDIKLGGSPRASLALMHTSRALTFLRGRDYVVPDDIVELVFWVLRHRLVLQPKVEIAGIGVKEIISRLLNAISIPT